MNHLVLVELVGGPEDGEQVEVPVLGLEAVPYISVLSVPDYVDGPVFTGVYERSHTTRSGALLYFWNGRDE